MRRWKRWVLMVITVLLLQVSSMTVDEDNRIMAAAPANHKEIRFKVGSDQALVNGKKLKMEKPYILNDATMVPVSTLVNGLGIKGEWTEPGYEYVITAGNRKIELYHNSAAAVINRKEIYFNGDTAIRNGKLMAPVREIAEGLGAVIELQKDKTITVTRDHVEADRDMSRVGSPSTGWSKLLDAPWYYKETNTGYVFDNYDKSLNIELRAVPLEEPVLNKQQFMDVMRDQMYVYSQINDAYIASIDGVPYGRVDTEIREAEDQNSYRLIHHVYTNDKYIFLLSYDREDYTLQEYEKIVKSFRPQYRTEGITNIVEPSPILRERTLDAAEELGLVMKLPIMWESSSDDRQAWAHSGKRDKRITARVYDPGSLTAAQLAEKRLNYLQKSYHPGNVRLIDSSIYQLPNHKSGTLQRITVFDGNQTYTVYELHVVDNGYGFLIVFEDESSITGDSKSANEILPALEIDAAKIKTPKQKPEFMYDWDEVSVQQLKRLKAEITLPKSWVKMESLPEFIYYNFPVQGELVFISLKDIKLEAAIQDYKENIDKNLYKKIFEGYTSINSHRAYEFQYESSLPETSISIEKVILIQHGDNVDYISLNVLKAAYSEHIQQQLKQALQTYQFTKKKSISDRGTRYEKV